MHKGIVEKVLKDIYFDGEEVDSYIWELFLTDLKKLNVTLESLSDDLQKGIDNGISIDDQIKAVFDFIKPKI